MRHFDLNTDIDPKPVVTGEPLKIELIPSTSWGDNLRSRMKPAQWNRLRKNQYQKANHQCEICGQTGKNQGYNWAVECHEVWGYDDVALVQELIGLIALCPLCHLVKHFGLAQVQGRERQALQHLQDVNGWDHGTAKHYISYIAGVWKRRSKYDWRLDLGYLQRQGIEIEGP